MDLNKLYFIIIGILAVLCADLGLRIYSLYLIRKGQKGMSRAEVAKKIFGKLGMEAPEHPQCRSEWTEPMRQKMTEYKITVGPKESHFGGLEIFGSSSLGGGAGFKAEGPSWKAFDDAFKKRFGGVDVQEIEERSRRLRNFPGLLDGDGIAPHYLHEGVLYKRVIKHTHHQGRSVPFAVYLEADLKADAAKAREEAAYIKAQNKVQALSAEKELAKRQATREEEAAALAKWTAHFKAQARKEEAAARATLKTVAKKK